MKVKIPLYRVLWEEDDVEAVARVIRRGMYWTGGPENELFEGAVAGYVDREYGVSFNSGTSALTALLLAYGVGLGDAVVVPAFTYPSPADAVGFTGACRVYADNEEETYGLDPDDVERRITERTKAIIAVHIYGLPCRIRELRELAEDNGVLLIEDAAEALGAHVQGRMVGSFGDAAFFSFAGNKVLTTGEGGMAVTDSMEIRDKLRRIRQERSWRMSTLTAALGLSQFKRLGELLEMRRRNAEYLTERLSGLPGVSTPLEPPGFRHSYQFYTVRVERGRNRLRSHLEERGVTTKIYFDPLDVLLVTMRVSEEVLTLPMYPGLTVEEMDHIAEAVREFVQV